MDIISLPKKIEKFNVFLTKILSMDTQSICKILYQSPVGLHESSVAKLISSFFNSVYDLRSLAIVSKVFYEYFGHKMYFNEIDRNNMCKIAVEYGFENLTAFNLFLDNNNLVVTDASSSLVLMAYKPYWKTDVISVSPNKITIPNFSRSAMNKTPLGTWYSFTNNKKLIQIVKRSRSFIEDVDRLNKRIESMYIPDNNGTLVHVYNKSAINNERYNYTFKIDMILNHVIIVR